MKILSLPIFFLVSHKIAYVDCEYVYINDKYGIQHKREGLYGNINNIPEEKKDDPSDKLFN